MTREQTKKSILMRKQLELRNHIWKLLSPPLILREGHPVHIEEEVLEDAVVFFRCNWNQFWKFYHNFQLT